MADREERMEGNKRENERRRGNLDELHSKLHTLVLLNFSRKLWNPVKKKKKKLHEAPICPSFLCAYVIPFILSLDIYYFIPAINNQWQ